MPEKVNLTEIAKSLEHIEKQVKSLRETLQKRDKRGEMQASAKALIANKVGGYIGKPCKKRTNK